jgi:hypothetical protein
LRRAASEIEISETAEFVSTDEDEFWREMDYIGWDIFLKKIKTENADKLLRVKEAILQDLQSHKQSDGIHFSKTVIFISAVK